jgi:Planctomycete cytochrome C/WD domain, G-beta repeat
MVGGMVRGRMASLGLFSAFLCVICGSFSSADESPKGNKVTYEQHVLPVLREKCLACHGPDKKSGGLRLHTYTNLLEGSSSGPVVKPGDPDGSPLFLVTSHKQEPFMPPKSPKLLDASIDLLRQWIQAGAPENAGSKVVVANKPKIEIALNAAAKGKPDGPPPMPPAKLNLEPVVKTARANAVTALAASPWAPLVAVGGQKQVLLYHADTLDLLGVLPFPEGTPHVLKFSRNGSLLLAGGGHDGKSGKVVVWSVVTGERAFTVGDELDAVLAADISADQTQIALGGPSKVVRVYSTRDGKLLHEIKKHTDWIYAIEYSPDGVLLATGDRNGGLFVWEAYTAREYFALRGHTAAVTDLSWRADANVLASASEDTTVRLWEMENGNQIKAWGAHGGGALSVNYARDGRLVTTGRDRVTKVWDGNGAQQRALDAFPDVGLRATFAHDGSRVIASDWTGQVRVWTAADGKPQGQLVSNPLGVAERLEIATKDVAAREAALKQLTAAAAASQAAAQKAATELAAAQQAAADTGAVAKVCAEAVVRAKGPADQANAALAAAQAVVAAKDVVAKAYAEAAAKIKGAADQAKTNKDLAAAEAKSRELAAQAAAELAAAQKPAGDLAKAAQAANEALATAQRAQAVTAGPAAQAAKTLAALTPAANAAATKAAADKAALDQATAGLAAAKAALERLKAVAVTRTASNR